MVGGAVRDTLMGLEPKDRDWVVVGSSEDEMLSLGFTRVGADFPVFLHPETREEYALARRERKTGRGYVGFETVFTPDVTLEEDLARRDLTVNSMAMDENGDVVDLFGCRNDLENKVLKHTSFSFREDPVRVLRIARFVSRFGEEWSVDPSTVSLVQYMKDQGTLDELVADRVWKEMSRALLEPHPALFTATLAGMGVLRTIFPETFPTNWAPNLTWEEVEDLSPSLDENERLTVLVVVVAESLVRDNQVVFLRRLRIPSRMRERVTALLKWGRRDWTTPEVILEFLSEVMDPVTFALADEIDRLKGASVFGPNAMTRAYRAFTSVRFSDLFGSVGPADHEETQAKFRAARLEMIERVLR